MSTRYLSPATIAVGLLAFAVGAGAAGAASSLGPPKGSPDPKLMVLRPADLHARVVRERYYRDAGFPSVISFERYFGAGRTRGSKLVYAGSAAEVGQSTQVTARLLASVRRIFGSKQARAELEKGFAQGIRGSDIRISELQVGHVQGLGAGPGSFDLPMRVKILGLRTDLHIAVFRVDRLLGALELVGAPGSRVPISTMTRLAKLMTGRMAAQLGPRNVSAPVVSGTAQVGQTLTASPGGWTENPTRFSYQWRRCDSSGSSCATIAGADGPRYVLTGADAGFTIRVSVSARNSHGFAAALSAPTGVVLASQAPANTSLPTIAGTAQAGQIVAGSTGSWTGSPTSFAFQWQRCDSAGSNCAAIAGATSATYTVGSADVGATLRVAVTATNASGQTTALSPQTAVVT